MSRAATASGTIGYVWPADASPANRIRKAYLTSVSFPVFTS